MKEEMLQNDTKNGKPEYEKPPLIVEDASGNVIVNEEIMKGSETPRAKGTEKDSLFENGKEWIGEHADILKIVLPVAAAAVVVLILIAVLLFGETPGEKEVKESFVSSSPRQETETEMKTGDIQEMTETPAGNGNAAYDRQKEELANTQEQLAEAKNSLQSLHDAIFGETGQGASLGCVTAVTGITDREKREIGFLESDFLKDAGAFLAKQQIQTKRIIIEDRIAGSSDASVAFQGRLEGKDDYILDVVFYPDYPGEYIFLLRNVKGNERETEGSSSNGNSQAAVQETGQTAAQTQNNQTAAPVQNNNQTAAMPQSTETAVQPQNSYDATNLSVKKIPETLLNYIDNRYEFQYSLYDWLYHHGKKDVGSATVTDYSIDGDSRSATIELRLSDGSSLTSVYDKTDNSFSFER